MSLQSHVISGFVGGTPETRQVQTQNGPQSVTSMSVAVNNNRNREAAPTWYRVTMWNGLGDTVAKYVTRGDFVVVQSDRLSVSQWTDNDGNARATLELTANTVDFSANRRGSEDSTDNTSPNAEDIPF